MVIAHFSVVLLLLVTSSAYSDTYCDKFANDLYIIQLERQYGRAMHYSPKTYLEKEMHSKIVEHLEGTTLTQHVLDSSSERFTQ